MKRSHTSILSSLDNALRWTGFPARVADDLADDMPVGHRRQPLRWGPLFVIAFSCAVFVFCLIWPQRLHLFSPGAVVSIMTAIAVSSAVLLIHTSGPLGKPSREDDEREAALRKDSFMFALGLLAGLNCVGQPILLIVSHWQDWQPAQSANVVFSALILNVTLLGTLPTLYASWASRKLPSE